MRKLSQLSLTQRLTLMFVTASSAVLLLLGFVIASSVEQHFEDLDMVVLSGKMELARGALQNVTTHDGLTEFTHQLARSLIGHHGLELLIVDTDHSIIFATEHASFRPDMVLSQAANGSDKPVLWNMGERTYRAIVANIATAAIDSAGTRMQVVVAVATDIGHHSAYMQSFLLTLWLFVTGAAATTGLLGWIAVHRGLAPLRSMRDQAKVVTAQQLSHRLVVQSVPLELAQLAQSLNDMLQRLELAFSRLSDFSSDIAHELRTPVSNLMTQTQVALSHPRSAGDYRSVLESNSEELERMARMISDMLLLAKADNGLVLPNRQSVCLAEDIRALFEYHEWVAEEKGLRLSLTGQADVQADREMLRRAINNLLSNAIRHAGAASTVSVTLKQTPEWVTIAVENSGETIPKEFLDRVFDRFFRVDPSRQRSPDGTGLGLAITQSIIAAHGGTISVSSDQGKTTFIIQLH